MMQRGKITGQTALMTTRWRSGDKGDSSPPLIKKMLCASEPAIKVIGGYEVIFKRTSQPAEITLDQDNGKPSVATRSEKQLVLPGCLGLVARRHEDISQHPRFGRSTSLALEVSHACAVVEHEPINL